MKKLLLMGLLPAICLFSTSLAQNLVVNPGLDQYITCPGFGQFSSTYIAGWHKPSVGSSDYYHYNCAGIQPSQQQPYSGEGYGGIICYNFGTEYREYITGTFSSPLNAGTTYQVSFYVSLNDGYIQAVKEIGAYISHAIPGPFSNALHLNVIPQVENTSGFVTDTANWKIITGSFVASGGEQFITIGNFHDDSTTSVSQPGTIGSFGAYYFVDAVSVIQDSTTSINNNAINAAAMNIYNGELHVNINNAGAGKYFVSGYALTGEMAALFEVNSDSHQFSIRHLPKGIYCFVLRENDVNMLSKKFVMLHD